MSILDSNIDSWYLLHGVVRSVGILGELNIVLELCSTDTLPVWCDLVLTTAVHRSSLLKAASYIVYISLSSLAETDAVCGPRVEEFKRLCIHIKR